MKESTRAAMVLGSIILIGFLIWNFIPNTTTLHNAQVNFNKTAEQVKLYVDNKTRDAVESTKLNTHIALDVVTLQEQMGSLIKSHRELVEKVEALVTENGQLKIYIANLESKAHTSSEVDKAILAGTQAHYKEFNEYKASLNTVFQTLGTALSTISGELTSLDARLTKVETQERSVLTKQTIVKTFYLHRHRCCR